VDSVIRNPLKATALAGVAGAGLGAAATDGDDDDDDKLGEDSVFSAATRGLSGDAKREYERKILDRLRR
jgi:hypothetical protein